MKEQIHHLAQEAGLFHNVNGRLYPTAMSAEECDSAYQKFAELIVTAIARQLAHIEKDDFSSSQAAENYYSDVLMQCIFGVE